MTVGNVVHGTLRLTVCSTCADDSSRDNTPETAATRGRTREHKGQTRRTFVTTVLLSRTGCPRPG